MALEYRHIPRDAGEPVDTVTVDQHWYLTEEKDRVVPEGNPAARWLWATPGMDVPRADAERLGAAGAAPVADLPDASGFPAEDLALADVQAEADTDEVPVEESKAKPPPPNKQRTKPGDKTAGGSVQDLRKRAVELGVQVDNRWGATRLQQEIADAEDSEG